MLFTGSTDGITSADASSVPNQSARRPSERAVLDRRPLPVMAAMDEQEEGGRGVVLTRAAFCTARADVQPISDAATAVRPRASMDEQSG